MRAALGVAVTLAAVGAAALLAAGRVLVVADPLPPRADAIVILAGSVPDRALAAADLYRAGLAPRVLVARPARRQDRPERVREARQLLAHRELEDRALRPLAACARLTARLHARATAALARVSPRPRPAAAARAPRAHASRARCRTRR